MKASPARPPHRYWFVASGIAICVAALALRTFLLGRNELWFDEAYSALLSFESPRSIVGELARDSSPPLYFVLLHLWSGVFGSSPDALRWFSVVAGLLAIPVAGVLAMRWWGPTASLLAMLLLAVSPLHVYYSREVRPYAWLALWCLLSLLALEKLIRSGRVRDGALYCAATLAGCYTHNYGLLLPAFAVVNILQRRLSPTVGLLCLAVIACGYAPWLPVLIGQLSSGTTRWIEPWWRSTPPALALVRTFATFSFAGGAPPYMSLGQQQVPGFVPVVSYGVFLTLVVRSLVGAASEHAHRVGIGLLLLLAVPFAISFWTPVYLVGRHDVIGLPLFLLLCARGIERFPRPISGLFVVVVLGLAGTALLASYRQPPERQMTARADALRGANAADVILCTGFTRNSLEYQVRLAGGRQRFLSFPQSSDAHRGWVDERAAADLPFARADAAALVTGLLARMQADDRLWIAHARELAAANDVLMHDVERGLRQVPCAGGAEAQGFTCWTPRPRQVDTRSTLRQFPQGMAAVP